MEITSVRHLYRNSLMKPVVLFILLLFEGHNSMAQSCDTTKFIIDTCKIRGATSISGTIVKDQEVDPGGTPANYEASPSCDTIHIRGGRGDFTYYYIDGIKVRGNSTLPKTATEEVQVITGGPHGDFGDPTGGIIRPNPAPIRIPKASDKEQKAATE